MPMVKVSNGGTTGSISLVASDSRDFYNNTLTFFTNLSLPLGTYDVLLVQFNTNTSNVVGNLTMTGATINSVGETTKPSGTDNAAMRILNITVTSSTQTMTGSFPYPQNRTIKSYLYM